MHDLPLIKPHVTWFTEPTGHSTYEETTDDVVYISNHFTHLELLTNIQLAISHYKTLGYDGVDISVDEYSYTLTPLTLHTQE